MAMVTRHAKISLLTTALFIATISSCSSNAVTPNTNSPTVSSNDAAKSETSPLFDEIRPVLISAQDFDLPIIGNGESALPSTVTSADDVKVTVTDSSRIIVLNEAIAEIVVSLGFSDKIIGRDATTTLAALESIPKVSSGHDISAESVLELKPTLVIG
ncbi:MAG: ABC transporter substrate-binding protein, partial [Acidimicrobiaceae bacterium]